MDGKIICISDLGVVNVSVKDVTVKVNEGENEFIIKYSGIVVIAPGDYTTAKAYLSTELYDEITTKWTTAVIRKWEEHQRKMQPAEK